MISAIIPAAGSGRRMKAKVNKQFMSIAGQPVLTRSLLSLAPWVDELIIVARPGEEKLCQQVALGHVDKFRIISGGTTRQQSVYNGLRSAGGDYVLVHDGNRPLVSGKLIQRVLEAARVHGAAIPVVPVVDTIKEIDDGFVVATLPRHRLRAVQTPQAFRKELLLHAHQHAVEQGIAGTDDSSLVESLNQPVAMVEGELANLKITTPGDLERAERILNARTGPNPPLRVGHGYDVHRLVDGRKLVLGGVSVPFEQGLDGHSDADVLVHAIIDALLGAAGLGDIGRHFPDSDPAWAGADSCKLLAHVMELVQGQGLHPANIDATIIAQRPRLSGYIHQMAHGLAEILHLNARYVNIKATTTETLGFAGRGEGIAAHCVCTLTTTGGKDYDS